jgi:hypothetical protein
MSDDVLPRAKVSQHLSESEWQCKFVRDFATAALWKTAHGFYFSVPHQCTRDDFEKIWQDLVKNGRKGNV